MERMKDTAQSGDFFDLQVNGYAGVDFQRIDLTAAQISHATKALVRDGTTRILATLITDRAEHLARKLERLEELSSREAKNVIVGYHLEGPFLNPAEGFRGAHNPNAMMAPDVDLVELLLNASGGKLRLLTLAPELPGSIEVIRFAVSRGVRVAIGHSDASHADIDAAIEAGATLCTHLGNGVPNMLPRHNNVIQRLLARDELFAVFIPDGIHVPADTLKNICRAKPANKVLFTTDCMAAAGAPPGRYTLGEHTLFVAGDGVVRSAATDSFAGSSLVMSAAARNVQRFLGMSAQEAQIACGARVAEVLGL
jgi:N-acetylglucosamine-6-phosphate deacetylase